MNRLHSILLLLAAQGTVAQTTASRRTLAGTLLDPSETPVPGVHMVLQSGDNSIEAVTSAAGTFRFDGLAPGSYELRASVPAFNLVVRKLRIGPRNPQPLTIRLTLATLKEEMTVPERDNNLSFEAANNADTISVERTMLDNLPFLDNNYLSALGRFLDPGTPGGAGTSIVVDGMEMRNAGVTASAIQEIRINNNPYTVEYPRWSRRRIEVITKSSADAYHGTFNFLFRDYHLNARDAFATERPQEQRRIFEGSLFGPVGKSKKTSFPALGGPRGGGPRRGRLCAGPATAPSMKTSRRRR